MNYDELIKHLKDKKKEYQQHIKEIDKMLLDLVKKGVDAAKDEPKDSIGE